MRRVNSFTVTELVVVVLVLSIVIPVLFICFSCGLSGSRELAKRTSCKMNLSAIAKGLSMYMASNNDQYPILPGEAWDSTATGTNYRTEPVPDKPAPRSVTALMFLLVRDGQGTQLFKCPSDNGAIKDPTPADTDRHGEVTYHWDFGPGKQRYCSYSYQVPMADNTNGVLNEVTLPPDEKPATKPAPASEGGLVIMADRAPTADWSKWTPTAAGNPDDVGSFMSPNHRSEIINILRADSSVSEARTPNCGLSVSYGSKTQDCIYTASDHTAEKDNKDDGIDFGGTAAQARHKGFRDSYLAGAKD